MQLISEDYRKQQETLHNSKKIDYGTAAAEYGEVVGQMIDELKVDSLLDYGCGHNLSLQKNLAPNRPFELQCYDPGVPEYSDEPNPAQMVVCIDVLEHIEPELLDNVLDHIESLTERVLFATVHCGPAGKVLPDGRNAHLIQQPPEWWFPKFAERFEVQGFHRTRSGFEIVCIANDYYSG